MNKIESIKNDRLKQLCKLISQNKIRKETGLAVLEGIHLAEVYIENGGIPEEIFINEEAMGCQEIDTICNKIDQPITILSKSSHNKLTKLTNATDIITLIKIPSQSIEPFQKDCIVLDRVQDPGNVGTILRCASAAGIKNIILDKESADVWSPKVLRAGMGAHFLLNIWINVDLNNWQKKYQGELLATSLNQSKTKSLYDLDLKKQSAWIFGNEGNGVRESLLNKINTHVKIPMLGQTESLNVAMAATICLFEQMRQRLPNFYDVDNQHL